MGGGRHEAHLAPPAGADGGSLARPGPAAPAAHPGPAGRRDRSTAWRGLRPGPGRADVLAPAVSLRYRAGRAAPPLHPRDRGVDDRLFRRGYRLAVAALARRPGTSGSGCGCAAVAYRYR